MLVTKTGVDLQAINLSLSVVKRSKRLERFTRLLDKELQAPSFERGCVILITVLFNFEQFLLA